MAQAIFPKSPSRIAICPNPLVLTITPHSLVEYGTGLVPPWCCPLWLSSIHPGISSNKSPSLKVAQDILYLRSSQYLDEVRKNVRIPTPKKKKKITITWDNEKGCYTREGKRFIIIMGPQRFFLHLRVKQNREFEICICLFVHQVKSTGAYFQSLHGDHLKK